MKSKLLRHTRAMLSLRHAAVRYRLGLLYTESLVRVADAVLAEGRDSQAAIELSILESPIMAEAGPIFERVCAEFGVAIPDKDEAIDELLRHHLESIASGACRPREGLEAIMRELYWPHFASERCTEYVGDSRGMHHLIGAYYSYSDLTERPHEVSWDGKFGAEAMARWEEFVRQHARDWLQRYDHMD